MCFYLKMNTFSNNYIMMFKIKHITRGNVKKTFSTTLLYVNYEKNLNEIFQLIADFPGKLLL